MKLYGIDFSSAPSKKKPIAVAECWLHGSVSEPCSNNELRLSCFHSIESLDLFEEFLSQRGQCLLTQAPGYASKQQLDEIGLTLKKIN